MKTKSLINILGKKYPKRIAKKYHDYVGLMCGKLKEHTNTILLCLDMDEEVLPYVKKHSPDLVLTHHPFIYGTKAKVLKDDPLKAKLYYELLNLNVPIYSMHTNFDEAKGGMNDALSEALGLINVFAPEEMPMMRIGELPQEMEINDFALKAKKDFDVPYSLLINSGKPYIKTVCVLGGAGGYDYYVPKNRNIDIYISGDCPHHKRREMVRSHMNYLDMPHEIEKIFVKQMEKVLKEIDPSLNIITIDHEKCPKVI